jgi:hypothetical protein
MKDRFFLKFFLLLSLLYFPGAIILTLIKGSNYLLSFTAGYAIMFANYILISRQSMRIKQGHVKSGFYLRFLMIASFLIILVKVAHLNLFVIISGVMWATVSFFITTFIMVRER